MPLHLESFIPEGKSENTLSVMVEGVRTADPLYISSDETVVHSKKRMKDAITGEEFGSIIYTLKIERPIEKLSIIDIDVVIDNDNKTRLKILNKLPGSSEANEYYDAEVIDQGGHFQLETVNRNACKDNIVDTEQEVFISAFPFSVEIHNDMEEFNRESGLEKDITIGDKQLRCNGFADDFMAPASLFHMGTDSNETYTYFFSKVLKIREVETEDFGDKVSFLIVDVDSGMGVIPVVMSRDCFDLDELAVGKVLEVKADIKADFSTYPPEEE